eukprot:2068592-Amphidinium_carterae.1
MMRLRGSLWMMKLTYLQRACQYEWHELRFVKVELHDVARDDVELDEGGPVGIVLQSSTSLCRQAC